SAQRRQRRWTCPGQWPEYVERSRSRSWSASSRKLRLGQALPLGLPPREGVTTMGRRHRVLLGFFLLCPLLWIYWAAPLQAYITAPRATVGLALSESTYITVVRVKKVSREKGVIV